jgi:hypothetical protein
MAKKSQGLQALSSKEVLLYQLRVCFLNEDLSPHDLHIATGVDVEMCADFMSHVLAALIFTDPPAITKEKKCK